ncbi:MAG: VOC family protein, partial [Dermatophilaceae bacterium]
RGHQAQGRLTSANPPTGAVASEVSAPVAVPATLVPSGFGTSGDPVTHPQILHTVLDTTDVRVLAEFYRRFLGLVYRPGDEPPVDRPDDADWLVLTRPDGTRALAFQEVDSLTPTTWPRHDVPMQLHLDLTVSGVPELERARRDAESLGARMILDRTDDEEEPLYVFADPSGHPFCVFVG